MENGRMNDYSSADLMAAILDVRDATAFNLSKLETRLTARIDGLSTRIDGVENSVGSLRHDMNRRFDRMDERFDQMDGRFDRLEGRVAALEPHDHSPAS
jgi:hypothetical protein